jgi:UCH-binding domain
MMGIAAGSQRQRPLSLTTVVNADDILASGVLNDADVLSALAPLLATSSEGSEAELIETLRSPQLRQALGSLTAALQVCSYTVLTCNTYSIICYNSSLYVCYVSRHQCEYTAVYH